MMAFCSRGYVIPASERESAAHVPTDRSASQSSFPSPLAVACCFAKIGKPELRLAVDFQTRYRTSCTSGRDRASTEECADAQAGNLAEAGYCGVRRAVVACTVASLFCSGLAHVDNSPPPLQHFLGLGAAHASLLQMPPESLNNRYYLVRSGESEFETFGVINTNPVTKTNMESGLSEIGKKQTLKAALQLKEMGACDGSCWIWPSITQRAYQTAEIIAAVNKINRSRIVPEYSFLDARGLGAYEGKSLNYISKVYEVDAESPNLRPPPYSDGTPNESVSDVFVRIRQLMSILETQYSGESIIIVAPDSDNLSVLEAALTGLDLRKHISLAFVPGEVRYVDLGSIPVRKITRTSGFLKCKNLSQCG